MNHEWVNIPASFLLLSYLLSVNVFVLVCPRKQRSVRWIYANVILFIIYSVMFATNSRVEGLRFFICMFIVWTGMLWLLWYVADMPLTNIGYYVIRAFFLGDFAASLCWQLVYYMMSRWNIQNKWIVSAVVLIPCCSVIFGISCWIERRYCQYLFKMNIKKKELFYVVITGIFFYFLANVSYISVSSPFSSEILSETYILRTLVEFGAVALLQVYHIHLIDVQKQHEIEAMKHVWEMQEANYNAYENSVALVNQKYHDLKHQIMLLRENISSEEKDGYLKQIEEKLQSYEVQNKTGNQILDTIMTAKNVECLNHGITLTSVIDGKSLAFIEPMDLVALFGNLLDNAIESLKKVEKKEHRLLVLSVAVKKNFVQIRVKNVCEEAVIFADGLPVTTKEDKNYHGFGVRSIRNIVEKYGGSLLMNCEEGWFEVCILIPGRQNIGLDGRSRGQ